MKKRNVETRELQVALDDKEILDYAHDLADRLSTTTTLEEEFAVIRKEFRDALAEQEVEINRLWTAIKTKQETRMIPCEVLLDFEQKKRVVVRADTQEVIETGAIPEADHQLEFGDREGVDDNPPGKPEPMPRMPSTLVPSFEVAKIPDDATCMTCENKVIAGWALNRKGEVAGTICQACADEAKMEYDDNAAAYRLPDKEDNHGER